MTTVLDARTAPALPGFEDAVEAPDPEEAAAEAAQEYVTVWDTGERLRVHPVAALFPMLSDDELADLAEDIRVNGQSDAIVLDQHRQLIDGRNRLAACAIAHVSPTFVTGAFPDAIALILSKNAMRRHMNKGQLAMAVAQAKYSPANTLPHWGDETELAAQLGVSQPRLAKAIGVARYARELATKVIAGTLPLDDAYAAAVEAKRARKTAAEDADRYRVELEQLRAAAPDLAEQVEDHRLTLKEALVEQGERQRKAAEEAERERERRALSRRQLEQAVFFLDPRAMTPEELAGHLYAHLDGAPHEWERESLARCAEVLTALHRLTTATPSIPSTTTSPQED